MLSIEGARYLYDSNLNSDNFTTFLEITNINQTRLLKIDNIEHEVYYKTSYLLTFYLLIEDGNYFYTIVKNNTELSDPNIYQKLKENKIYE